MRSYAQTKGHILLARQVGSWGKGEIRKEGWAGRAAVAGGGGGSVGKKWVRGGLGWEG